MQLWRFTLYLTLCCVHLFRKLCIGARAPFRSLPSMHIVWLWQVLSLSLSLSLCLSHSLTLCEKSNKQNTKRPSALSTEKVQRHASLLGAEIAAMLPPWPRRAPARASLNKQTALQCVTDSWLPSKKVTLPLQGLQRTEWPPLTHNTQGHGSGRQHLWQHRLFLAQRKPRRLNLPPQHFKKRERQNGGVRRNIASSVHPSMRQNASKMVQNKSRSRHSCLGAPRRRAPLTIRKRKTGGCRWHLTGFCTLQPLSTSQSRCVTIGAAGRPPATQQTCPLWFRSFGASDRESETDRKRHCCV